MNKLQLKIKGHDNNVVVPLNNIDIPPDNVVPLNNIDIPPDNVVPLNNIDIPPE